MAIDLFQRQEPPVPDYAAPMDASLHTITETLSSPVQDEVPAHTDERIAQISDSAYEELTRNGSL